jgi:hypothetical protein
MAYIASILQFYNCFGIVPFGFGAVSVQSAPDKIGVS